MPKKIKKLGLTKLFPEAVLYNTLEYPARHQDINGRYVLKQCSQRNKVHKSGSTHLRNNAGTACEGESNSKGEFLKGQNKAFGQREVFRRSFTLDMAVILFSN